MSLSLDKIRLCGNLNSKGRSALVLLQFLKINQPINQTNQIQKLLMSQRSPYYVALSDFFYAKI